MKKYIVYDKKTGEILSTGQCVDKVFELQTKEGEAVLEGIADDSTEKVDLATKKIIKK